MCFLLQCEDLTELGAPFLDFLVRKLANRNHFRLGDSRDRRIYSRSENIFTHVVCKLACRALAQPELQERFGVLPVRSILCDRYGSGEPCIGEIFA